MKRTIFEELGGTYIRHGAYLIPSLTLPEEEEQRFIGVWGQRHLRYLKEYRRGIYLNLLTSGELNDYLADIEEQAQEPLMYEKYPGSINDVSQLQFMVEKVKGYGYKNIGFILDRGYFSKENLRFMDNNGFGFIIMVKGCKEFISEQVRKQKGTFENDWGNQIAEFGVYGKTVHTFVYTADTKKR